MIKQYRIKIKPENEDIIPKLSSYYFYGLLMELIDGEYANQLHNNGINPINQYIQMDIPNNSLLWTINLLGKDAISQLTPVIEGQKTYCINNGNFQLKVLDLNMTFIPSDEMLLEHAKSIQDITKPTMEFLTPTSFKSNNEYLLFPSVEHIIRNLINRWNNYSTCFIIDDEDAILSLIQSTRIAGYRLQSSYFRMKGTQIPGFRGDVRFSTKLSIPIGELYKIILYFAQFSGVGIKTSLGMGATKIITGNKS